MPPRAANRSRNALRALEAPVLITAVVRKPRRPGRVEVYIDGELAFEVARAAARQHDLRPGRAIEQTQIDAIIAAEQRRQAMESAVAMLARRPRSEREVRRRLARRRYAPALIDETLGRLTELNLIDDAEFARVWTESRDRSSPRGRRLIVQELRGHGVDAAVAADAASTVMDEDAAYRVAAARLRSLRTLDYQSFRSRLGAHLQRRGFGWETSRVVIDRCWRELAGDAPADDLGFAME